MEGYFVEDSDKRCPNCKAGLPSKAKYCDQCGQKYTTGRIKLRTLLAEFFETVFNIESKFFRTVGALMVPGKLTREFIKGRHQTYFRPIRLFFVMAIVHFAVIAFVVDNATEEDLEKMQQGQYSRAFRAQFLEEMDTIRTQVTTYFGESPALENALDSLENRMRKRGSGNLKFRYLEHQGKKWQTPEVSFTYEEAFILPVKEVINHKEVTSTIGRFTMGQSLRVNRNPDKLLGFVISNLTWMILLMMPALALILKVLYIRKGFYFVEHLILSFHYHAFAFFVASPAYLLIDVYPPSIGIAFMIIFLYLFIAMKRVYQQGIFKTGIKFFMLNLMYAFVFSLSAVLLVLISALVF